MTRVLAQILFCMPPRMEKRREQHLIYNTLKVYNTREPAVKPHAKLLHVKKMKSASTTSSPTFVFPTIILEILAPEVDP